MWMLSILLIAACEQQGTAESGEDLTPETTAAPDIVAPEITGTEVEEDTIQWPDPRPRITMTEGFHVAPDFPEAGAPFSVIMAAKLFSVQKYVTHWNYSYDPLVLCVNKRFFDSLSPAHQSLLRTCAQEAMAYERQLIEKADEELPPKLVAAGMQLNRLTPEQIVPLKASQEPLYAECENNPAIGKELVDAFRTAAAQAEGR